MADKPQTEETEPPLPQFTPIEVAMRMTMLWWNAAMCALYVFARLFGQNQDAATHTTAMGIVLAAIVAVPVILVRRWGSETVRPIIALTAAGVGVALLIDDPLRPFALPLFIGFGIYGGFMRSRYHAEKLVFNFMGYLIPVFFVIGKC